MIVLLLMLLQIKHFLFDWVFQSDYEVNNKGTYWHPGGIQHSVKHAVGTFLVLLPFLPTFAVQVAVLDGLVHYHIDWAKQNVVRMSGLTPQDKMFWAWMGWDQTLHQLCYLAIAGFYGVAT